MDTPVLEDLLRLGAVLLLVAGNGFFVAAEYALVSSRATRLDAMAENGNRLAELVLRAKRDPNRFISGTQLGITMMSLALGWIGEDTMAHLLEPALRLVPFLGATGAVVTAHTVAVPIAFFFITLFHIVLGEQVPKLIALQRSETTAAFAIQPMRVWGRVLRPFIILLSWSTSAVLRALGIHFEGEHTAAHSAEELKMLLASSAALDETEQDIAERAVEFGELTARQIMVPRTEVDALPAQATLADLLAASVRTGHRRLPVYRDTPDQIIGIAHVRDALAVVLPDGAYGGPANGSVEERLRRVPVTRVMREPLIVPETLSVTQLMAEMRRTRQRMAVLVDEYGSTAGLVTWGDLLERLVGDVPDEFEMDQPEIQPQPDGSALVDGRTLIDDVNEHFDLRLDSEGYDTIGGFVFGRLGRRPDVGDEVEEGGYRFRVEAMDGLRIARLRLEPVDHVSAKDAVNQADGA